MQAMELMRQHATNGRLMSMVGKPAPVDIPADRGSPHTSDSEMSAVESLTGMKRGRLGHEAAAGAGLSPAGRPRRGLLPADVLAANNSGTTGSLKTNSSGCALTAALEGAAAAARRSPPHPRSAAQQPSQQVDLIRAPGSQESLDASVAGPPLSTAQQHALVNRILVSMGHAPLTSSTLAAIMAKTGPKQGSPPQSPSLLDPSVRGGSAFAFGQVALDGRRLSGDGAGPSRGFGHDLERAPDEQVCDPVLIYIVSPTVQMLSRCSALELSQSMHVQRYAKCRPQPHAERGPPHTNATCLCRRKTYPRPWRLCSERRLPQPQPPRRRATTACPARSRGHLAASIPAALSCCDQHRGLAQC